MSKASIGEPPPVLRAAIAADLARVRPLRRPGVRALALVPIAGLLLVSAPLVFDVRDVRTLGWWWSWGVSLLQLGVGLTLTGAALRDSVPGRAWPRAALAGLVVMPLVLVTGVTLATWRASPVPVGPSWLIVAGLCVACSVASAAPAATLSSILVVRAFPLRPAITGFLGGVGAGVMADAGWRLFCQYSEPAHVLVAHLGGILVAGLLGSSLTTALARRR